MPGMSFSGFLLTIFYFFLLTLYIYLKDLVLIKNVQYKHITVRQSIYNRWTPIFDIVKIPNKILIVPLNSDSGYSSFTKILEAGHSYIGVQDHVVTVFQAYGRQARLRPSSHVCNIILKLNMFNRHNIYISFYYI